MTEQNTTNNKADKLKAVWDTTKRQQASTKAKGPRSPRGEGSIYRTTVRGKVVWRAKKTFTTPDGETRTIIGTGQTRAEAQERQEQLHIQWLIDTNHIKQPTQNPNTPTLTEMLEAWMVEQETGGVKPNTRVRNKALITNHITPYFKGTPVHDITEESVKTFLYTHLPQKQNRQGGRLLGPSPIRGMFYILKSALTVAEKHEHIKDNPMRFMRAPQKPKADKTDLSYRVDDYSELFSALSDTNHPKHKNVKKLDYGGTPPFLYWFLTFYGLRQSERLGVSWDSFKNLDPEHFTHPDQEDRKHTVVLTIDRQLYNDEEKRQLMISDTTKTASGKRTIPIPADVAALFYRHKQQQQEQRKQWKHVPAMFHNLIFTTPQGLPIRQNADNERWRELLQTVGMKPLLGHEMRHLTATFLAEMDTPLEQVKLIIGHSKEAMTAYYTHQSENRKHKTILQLHNLLQQRSEADQEDRVEAQRKQAQETAEYEQQTQTTLRANTPTDTLKNHANIIVWESIANNPDLPEQDRVEAEQIIGKAKQTYTEQEQQHRELNSKPKDSLTPDEKLTLTAGPFSPKHRTIIKQGGSQKWAGYLFYKDMAFRIAEN